MRRFKAGLLFAALLAIPVAASLGGNPGSPPTWASWWEGLPGAWSTQIQACGYETGDYVYGAVDGYLPSNDADWWDSLTTTQSTYATGTMAYTYGDNVSPTDWGFLPTNGDGDPPPPPPPPGCPPPAGPVPPGGP